MYELLTDIQIGEQSFAIRDRGDYRMVLDCFTCLSDYELDEQERMCACLIIFYEDLNEIEDIASLDGDTVKGLVEAMFKFFDCNSKHSGVKMNYKAIDWDTEIGRAHV